MQLARYGGTCPKLNVHIVSGARAHFDPAGGNAQRGSLFDDQSYSRASFGSIQPRRSASSGLCVRYAVCWPVGVRNFQRLQTNHQRQKSVSTVVCAPARHAISGRTNSGKSCLLMPIVGAKIVLTTKRSQLRSGGWASARGYGHE